MARAAVRLIIATGAPRDASSSVKKRPRNNGVPSTVKYSGPARRYATCAGVECPAAAIVVPSQ
jgi:hypothetical protein